MAAEWMSDREPVQVQDTPEPADARVAMFAARARLLDEHQHITTAAELAPLMGEHSQEYWAWCIERVMEAGHA